MKAKALIFYDQLQLATKDGSDYGPIPASHKVHHRHVPVVRRMLAM